MKKDNPISATDLDRVIQMAWEDRTPFDVIRIQFGLLEKDVIALMRRHLTEGSFRNWRRRVTGRKTKHKQVTSITGARFRSRLQREITHNKISKR